MYTVSSKMEAMRALQKMLGVGETGRMDSPSVRRIKQITGADFDTVDYKAFLLIKEKYKQRKRAEYVAEKLRMDVKLLNSGSFTKSQVHGINLLLSEAIKRNRAYAHPPRGAYLTNESYAAVAELSRIFGIHNNKELTPEFIYMLIKNIEAYDLLDKNSASLK